MDITTNIAGTISLIDTNELSEESKLHNRVNNLLVAREGTIAGSRNFGLPQDYLEAPDADIALNLIAVELQEKLDEYIDDVDVQSVSGEFDPDGGLKATITVERS